MSMPTQQFGGLTLECHETVPCTQPVEAYPRLWTAYPAESWQKACEWYSQRLGGQWWPKKDGLTWVEGSRVSWIVEPSQLGPIVGAQQIAQSFGLDCGASVGSAARALLRYCGDPQYPYKGSLMLTSGTGDAYVECTPGIYADATLWDCKSYYYSILRRLPTWRLAVRTDGRLDFFGDGPGEADRRAAVLAAVATHKQLRNALVGCMTGRKKGSPYYHAGRQKLHRGGPGLFRGAGLLVRRVAWELTRTASVESDSKLSNTDCVLTTGGQYPGIWDEYDLVVEKRQEGEADVCCPVIYRIGPHETEWYRRGSRFRLAEPRPASPCLSYVGDWLRVA